MIAPHLKSQRLDAYYKQARDIILARQDPITGLLPASTANTVHGDYSHAWVRDNVYSILGVWGLSLAYRREDNDDGRAYLLEQSVVKLMRGLLIVMMKQSGKVERFKHTQEPRDALHAKFDTHTGQPVVGDDEWGHLQFDATALFLLVLAQTTAAGLRIIFTIDEVNFIQNLTHYISRAYLTPDYGIWERGHKTNQGMLEVNASSVGMAKAALEAMRGLDLFCGQGGRASVVHTLPDDIGRMRSMLEAMLPRESDSKEVDAALLSVIGFPAFAVENVEVADRTREEIVTKLEGRYGCKRFLRDGHQTVLEDTSRLHYEPGELRQFEHIECEWPLFFTYLLLDGALREDWAQAHDYRERLERLCVERDGQRVLPELYYIPADKVEAEKAAPHSQSRVPNDNAPLVWAQSLYLLGVLLEEGYIHASDIDPLGRRLRVGRTRDTRIQMALLAADAGVKADLEDHGILTETPHEIKPIQLHHASELAGAFNELGRNHALGLSGRPRRWLGTQVTCQVFTLHGETMLFLPQFLDQRNFYLNLDNQLLIEQLKAELAHVQRHWDRPGRPLLVLLITASMLQAGGHDTLLALMKDLQAGSCDGIKVQVKRLGQLLPSAAQDRIDHLHAFRFSESTPQTLDRAMGVGVSAPVDIRKLSPDEARALRREPSSDRLVERLAASANPYEQIELIAVLWAREGSEFGSKDGISLNDRLESIYRQAGEARLWGLVRRAAGLLEKTDEKLEDAVAEVVVRRKRLAVGRAYSREAVISESLNRVEIARRLRAYGGEDPRGRVLIQEAVLYLGMLIKADPDLFRGTLTLRPWHMVQLLTAQIAWEQGMNEADAFEALLELSPHALLDRLRQVIVDDQDTVRRLESVQSLQHHGAGGQFTPVSFSSSANPNLPPDAPGWRTWREVNGVLTRSSAEFFPRVWEILEHCKGLIIGDRLDSRNCLESESVRGDMTPAEQGFALRVEDLLNNIQAPEYRQLNIEALIALSEFFRANTHLRVDDFIALDVLIGRAVRRAWAESRPQESYDEHCPDAWDAFYDQPVHQVGNAIIDSLHQLLVATDPEATEPA